MRTTYECDISELSREMGAIRHGFRDRFENLWLAQYETGGSGGSYRIYFLYSERVGFRNDLGQYAFYLSDATADQIAAWNADLEAIRQAYGIPDTADSFIARW